MSAARAQDLTRTDELEVHLAPMRRRHLRSVLRIEGHAGHHVWSLGLFMSELSHPDNRCYLVAKVGSEVVGFGGMLFVGPDGHVTTMSVHPDWQRHQIGTRVMLGLCRHALARGGLSAITLEVRATNLPAQGLYRAFGFAPVGVRKNYYSDIGEDALIMWAHEVDQPEYAERLDRLEGRLRGTTVTEGVSW